MYQNVCGEVRVDLRRGFRACRYIYFKKIKKEGLKVNELTNQFKRLEKEQSKPEESKR